MATIVPSADDAALMRKHVALATYAVTDVARRLVGPVEYDRLVYAALLGLLHAVQTHDRHGPTPLITYANAHIAQLLSAELRRAAAAGGDSAQRDGASTVAPRVGLTTSHVESAIADVERALAVDHAAVVLKCDLTTASATGSLPPPGQTRPRPAAYYASVSSAADARASRAHGSPTPDESLSREAHTA